MGRGGGGGGGGGRIRFRASKSGHGVDDAQDELGRNWRNASSKFSAINAGCFYKSRSAYCPSRLTDFYCVMWSRSQEATASVAANAPNGTDSNRQQQQRQQQQQQQRIIIEADVCSSGDFATASIIEAATVLPALLLIAGLVLNLLTARVALRHSSKQLPVCYYLVGLCAIDTVMLCFRCLDLWLQSAFDLRLTLTLLMMDESACQLLNMLYSCLHHFKAMLQIAMAVDSRRLVVRPLHCVERYTAEWVKNSLILMCVLLVLLNSHHLWTLALVKENAIGELDRAYHCGWGATWPVTELFTTWLWPLADLLLGDLVPTGVVLWAAGSGFRHLWRHEPPSAGGDVPQRPAGTDRSRGSKATGLAYHIIDVSLFHRVSVALLACSLAYATLQSPSAVHSCVMYVKFLTASLAARAAGARSLGQIYQPTEDEWRLFIARMCSALQPLTNSVIVLATVPHFRLCPSVLRSPGLQCGWRECETAEGLGSTKNGPVESACKRSVAGGSNSTATVQVAAVNVRLQGPLTAV